jgi:hypothetical protein
VALVTLAFVGGLAFVLSTREEPSGRPTGVWSAEHGHYH